MRLWAPPPSLSVSEWADANRRLSPEASAEPGRWITHRAEYQRAIMDAFNDPLVSEVVVMSSAQVGKTEILNNVVGYFVDQDPSPILVVQPTIDMGEAWSKDRIAPMFRDTPALRGKVKDPRSRDSGNTLLHKSFPGGHLTIAGSNSAASLASRPVRIVLLDEADRFPASAGTEGDPVRLAYQRTANFWNRKRGIFSTPTIKGESRIEMAYDASDKRRFSVPCPHCGEFQFLVWSQVKWTEGEPDTASYECQHCRERWNDGERWRAIREGKWEATAPFSGVAGFHLNAIYSPWVKLGELAMEWYAAQRSDEQFKTFVNTKLGETWEERHEQKADVYELQERGESYLPIVPHGAAVITAGVDVQADRLALEIVAWGKDEESWSLDYREIPGDTERAEVWRDLDELLLEEWEHESGHRLKVAATCIDSGYRDAMVLRFVRDKFQRNVWATKGKGGDLPIWPRKPSRKAATPFFVIGVDAAKDTISSRLKIDEPGPNYCHFPVGRPIDYFEMLTAERKVTTYRHGFRRREWRKDAGSRNEALDCRNYAYAALHGLYTKGLKLSSAWSLLIGSIPKRDLPEQAPPPPRVQQQTQQPRGFLGIDRNRSWFGR